MKSIFGNGAQQWELRGGKECSHGCTPLSEFRDRSFARLLLQPFKGDTLQMAAMRKLLSRQTASLQLCGMTDQNVIDQIANLLSRGFVHAHTDFVPVGRVTTFAAGSGENSKKASAAEVVREAKPAQVPAVQKRTVAAAEASSLPHDADQPAIAVGLKSASANGIPFCEECMKASLQQVGAGGVHG